MTIVPAAEVVHKGLVMSITDQEGCEVEGVVHSVVLHPTTGKPDLVVLHLTTGSVVTIPLEGMTINKHWTVQ